MEEMRDHWDITAKTITRFRTIFDEPVTKADAIKLFNSHEYVDIIDEEIFEEIAIDANY